MNLHNIPSYSYVNQSSSSVNTFIFWVPDQTHFCRSGSTSLPLSPSKHCHRDSLAILLEVHLFIIPSDYQITLSLNLVATLTQSLSHYNGNFNLRTRSKEVLQARSQGNKHQRTSSCPALPGQVCQKTVDMTNLESAAKSRQRSSKQKCSSIWIQLLLWTVLSQRRVVFCGRTHGIGQKQSKCQFYSILPLSHILITLTSPAIELLERFFILDLS